MTKVLTVPQAADMMQVKPETIRDYLRSGKLLGAKVGRDWRILDDDVIAMIRQAQAQPDKG